MPQRFASIWDALEDSPEMAANMKARSSLMVSLAKVIQGWKLTQTDADAAQRLDITQPRLNDLLGGRIEKFSLDALLDLSARAKSRVQVKLLK